MISRLFLLLSLVLQFNLCTSQSTNFHKCGVTIEDQQKMDLFHPNDFKGRTNLNRNAPTYIPVKFHICATDEGAGRLELYHVLNQLCVLNQHYESSNIIFYIYQGFNYIDQTNIYQDPSGNANAVQGKKNFKALNVFITENADNSSSTSGGTVLGYYSPQGDYIIIRKKELIDKSSTLSHEIGHFLSLRHTFYGWENDPYDKNKHGDTVKLTSILYRGENIPVEVMNQSNCTAASDQICDTPPDYNFGFGAAQCAFNYKVYDRNKELIVPMVKNQMGYFVTCDSFYFTDGQTTRMLTNFNSTSRNYIRSSYIPNATFVTGIPEFISPLSGVKINTFDKVKLDWKDMDGATMYLLEIRGQSQYYSEIVTESEFTANYLRKNSIYTWTVRPYNEGNACASFKTSSFRTGDVEIATSTEDQSVITQVSVYPNPLTDNKILTVSIQTPVKTDCSLELFNTIGQKTNQRNTSLSVGTNNIEMNLNENLPGVYLLKIGASDKYRILKVIIP